MAGKDNLKPFKKGQSGNPGGRPKADIHIRDLAREHTAAALSTLVSIAKSSKSDSARVAAASVIIERGWGRAPQTIDLNVLHQLSDADIDKRINQLAGALALEAGNAGTAAGEAAPTEH